MACVPPSTPVRVLIVEDEPEFLRSFSESIAADATLCLAGAVGTGREALSHLSMHPPDVMLIDLGLPDMHGVEVIRHAARVAPGCDCLVITLFGDDANVMASLEAGATGYLLKDASNVRIAAAVHEVRQGGAPISPSIARRVLARFRQPQPPLSPSSSAGQAPAAATAPGPGASHAGPATPRLAGAPGAAVSPLTERELQILQLVAKGFSFDTVGEVLAISPHTVVAHVKSIYRKLAVHSRGEAVYEASQLGWL